MRRQNGQHKTCYWLGKIQGSQASTLFSEASMLLKKKDATKDLRESPSPPHCREKTQGSDASHKLKMEQKNCESPLVVATAGKKYRAVTGVRCSKKCEKEVARATSCLKSTDETYHLLVSTR